MHKQLTSVLGLLLAATTAQGATDSSRRDLAEDLYAIPCEDAGNTKIGGAEEPLNINDSLVVLNYLFAGEELTPEEKLRSDADGSGQVDITDVIGVLNHVFLGEISPATMACYKPRESVCDLGDGGAICQSVDGDVRRGDLNRDGRLDEEDVKRMACLVGHPYLANYLNTFECSAENMGALLNDIGEPSDLARNMADFTGELRVNHDDYFSLVAAVESGHHKPFLTAFTEDMRESNEWEQNRLFQSAINELIFFTDVLRFSRVYEDVRIENPDALWLLADVDYLKAKAYKNDITDMTAAWEYVFEVLTPEMEEDSEKRFLLTWDEILDYELGADRTNDWPTTAIKQGIPALESFSKTLYTRWLQSHGVSGVSTQGPEQGSGNQKAVPVYVLVKKAAMWSFGAGWYMAEHCGYVETTVRRQYKDPECPKRTTRIIGWYHDIEGEIDNAWKQECDTEFVCCVKGMILADFDFCAEDYQCFDDKWGCIGT